MKRTLMALIQLAVIGGLAVAGLLMTITSISTVIKIFAFILGEWIYTALILFVGSLFFLVPIGIGVSMILQHIENSKKEPGDPFAGTFGLRWGQGEKEEEQD